MSTRRVRWLAFSLVLLALGSARFVAAVVVQVNGVIVPDNADNIQNALNRGENGCPNPANAATCYANNATPANNNGNTGSQGAIDKVNEARVTPEIFVIPQDSGGNYATIKTTFLWHGGAYYRNTFGWYNVGDDLTKFTNLHAIITPALDAASAASLSAYYYQAGENTPFQNSINFQTEFTAGRYKGGFVGFYLITPEGSANGDSGQCHCGPSADKHFCGYYDYTSNSSKCVGHLYFTEHQLNGDGNYVHYLLYQTKVLDAQKKPQNNFYFSFEDTYRSSDVGTADDTVFVEGLVVPCVPSAEICNGLDDNCNGVIDDNLTDVGAGFSCSSGGNPLKGECKAGTYACVNTGGLDVSQSGITPDSGDHKVCKGEVLPTGPVCNGKDNLCTGSTTGDAPPSGGWASLPAAQNLCSPTASLGECNAQVECSGAGGLVCVQSVSPQPEMCDGKDDDCDGLIDDQATDVGGSCGSFPQNWGKGLCKAGTLECLNIAGQDTSKPSVQGDVHDAKICVGEIGPVAESCNGIDDNCNGLVDDNPTGLSQNCMPLNLASCGHGHEICVNGTKVCVGFALPQAEHCNGLDDDCNVLLDDNPIDVGQPCGVNKSKWGVGICTAGASFCENSMSKDIAQSGNAPDVGDKLGCAGEVGPTTETCNGKDDNCDGIIDNAPSGTSLPGVGVGCTSACGPGTTVCRNGVVSCSGPAGGGAEYCDGKDDNCNAVIDDNPVDVGQACGATVINTAICQNDKCMPGSLQCINSAGQNTGTPGVTGDSRDHRACVGEAGGSAETCNGIDDDCDGVVDDNVNGTGGDCVPDGSPADLKLPLQGECVAGKTLCVQAGKCKADLKCVGGVPPRPKVCSLKDNDCDGKPDTDGPCPDPTQRCTQLGQCSVPCSNIEFTPCPGGLVCQDGYCVPPELANMSAGSGGSSADAGTVGLYDGGTLGAADGGNAVSGSGGSSIAADGGVASAGTGSGSAGTNSTTGASGTGSNSNLPPRKYAIATGGGGSSCSAVAVGHDAQPWAALSWLGVVVWFGRRRSSTGRRKQEVRS